MPLTADVTERLTADARQIIARYPVARSALLPMLHLVQSEEGYISPDGIAFCARTARSDPGRGRRRRHVLHAVQAPSQRRPTRSGSAPTPSARSWVATRSSTTLEKHLGIGHDETTGDGTITLERVECNAGCDYAPVVMVNWEFFDNQTPGSAKAIVDKLRAGERSCPPVAPRRSAPSRRSPGCSPDSSTATRTRVSAPVRPPSRAPCSPAARAGRRRTPVPGRRRSTAAKQKGQSMTTTLTPILTAFWDEPRLLVEADLRAKRRVRGAAQGPRDAARPTSSPR